MGKREVEIVEAFNALLWWAMTMESADTANLQYKNLNLKEGVNGYIKLKRQGQ